MDEISWVEAESLLAALDDPSPSVRLAALRALVRLNLSCEIWMYISRYAIRLLRMPPTGEEFAQQTLDDIPYREVLEAAAFVPTRDARNRLFKKYWMKDTTQYGWQQRAHSLSLEIQLPHLN